MPLGTEVGLGPDDTMLDGDLASPLQQTGTTPSFRPMSIVAKWSLISATAEQLFELAGSILRRNAG